MALWQCLKPSTNYFDSPLVENQDLCPLCFTLAMKQGFSTSALLAFGAAASVLLGAIVTDRIVDCRMSSTTWGLRH